MREIKFRAKRSNDNVWIYGHIVKVGNNIHLLEEGDMREDGHHIQQESDRPTWVDEDTIGQFTGLKDVNGKEIYEGDIVEADRMYPKERDNELGTVVYNDMLGTFCIRYTDNYSVPICNCSIGRVVGNIQDNLELLK